MNLNNLIADAILAAGGNGLVNGDLGCGCDVNDLAPCDSPDLDECRVARGRVLGPGERMTTAGGDSLGPGDVWYEPLEATGTAATERA